MSNSQTLNAPTSYGRINENNSTAVNSKALVDIEALAKTWTYQEFNRLASEGHSVIWGGSSWEAPLIRACGTIPIPINELWRENSRHSENIAESYFQIPAEFCSMIKAMAGRLHDLKKDTAVRRILHFGSGCEPICMVLEHARKDGFEVYTIDAATAFNPEDRRDELVRFLVKELDKVGIWLTGKPVDQDRLREEIRLKNKVNKKIRRILELRLKNPFYLTAGPTLRILMGGWSYLGNPERYLQILDQAIAELEEAAKTPDNRFHVPVILVGGGTGGPGLINAIEESRGAILGFVIFSTSDFREDVPPLESIAHYLFDAQLKGELGEGAGASATHRHVRVEELLKETGARGIINSIVTACPYASVVQQLERNYFKKQGIPMVALENTVHNEPPTEEQVMKVKTFIDMLS
jgi:benzoyl-CoA reductase/2-hydroxyglutaryl-CoA dehydratase subunit BcrC/BadD/HgdB